MAFNRKAKLRDNIEAIRTLFELEKQGTAATPDQREILSRYCGFGGLKCILNPASNLMDAATWAKSDRELFPMTAELHRLIRDNSTDDKEYKRYFDSLKSSVLTAFYTPPEVVSALADTLQSNGITPNRLLDPSAGQGVFISAFEPHAPKAEVMAFDKDLITGKLLSHLYPQHKVRAEGFERIEKPFTNYFDTATSNIPFGDVAVFDPEFTTSKEYGKRSATKAIHNYFFLKGLDAVRDGGIVAFITSQGVMNAREGAIRMEMLKRADLVSAIRLPNNLFVDSANTEVGSDLIILQKNENKQGVSELDKLFANSTPDSSGITTNNYFQKYPEQIVSTKVKIDTDPYGKPAMVYLHSGGVEGIADDMRKVLSRDFTQRLNVDLYNGIAQQPIQHKPTAEDWHEVGEMMLNSNKRTWNEHPPEPEMFSQRKEVKEPAKKEEKLTVEAPTMNLYDLFNLSQEERELAQRGLKKKPAPKQGKRNAPALKTLFDQPLEQAKAAEPPQDPDAVYAAIDWDENPPINGFYETMMRLGTERRAELRKEAAMSQQRENVQKPQAEQKPAYPIANGFEEEHRRRYERHLREVKQHEEVEKLKEELKKPRPFTPPLEPHYKEGTMVADGNQLGYLKGITKYGATFHPLQLDKVQREKAELYIAVRDSYERLYSYEAKMHEENKEERANLNTAHDKFVEQFGHLNEKSNVKFLLMDASGRDMLSLERAEIGQFIKADIFDHPVVFSLNEVTHVDTPMEAMSASLNRYGTINLDYMESICDSTQAELLKELDGRLFFNPLVANYEIKDRFVAGNVVEKMEHIARWANNNEGHERMAEVEKSLTALQDATPRPITYDELDFNFGERWIPTGMYTTYIKHLFETNVAISYSESIDEYSVKCGSKNAKITDQYDGVNLLKHALVNTVPDISKSGGKDENGRDIKVRDSEAIQLTNSKIDEIRGGFTDWLNEHCGTGDEAFGVGTQTDDYRAESQCRGDCRELSNGISQR